MKTVMTYGTYDIFHYGHVRLLERARALGDRLVVVLSTDEYIEESKGQKPFFNYAERKTVLESLKCVDKVVVGRNFHDREKYIDEFDVDAFAIGDDWKGKFDFLQEEGVEVVYLPRTPEISSSKIKKDLYDPHDVNGESKDA